MTSPFARGLAHLQARRFARARPLLGEAVRAGGDSAAWAAQELVQSYLRAGEASAAEPAMRALLPAGEPLLDHSLAYLWRRLGRAAEARALLDGLVAAPRHPLAAHLELGFLRFAGGDAPGALEMLRRAENAFRRHGDAWGVASALTHRATIALLEWRFDEALHIFEDARVAKEACGDLLGLATVLSNEGYVRLDCWEHAAARDCFERALALQQRLRSAEGELAALSGLQICQLTLGEPERARTLGRQALRVVRRLPPGLATALGATVRANLAEAEIATGRIAAALPHARAAVALVRETGDQDRTAVVASTLADLVTRAGRPGEALAAIAEVATDHVSPRTRTALLVATGRARLRAGDPEGALAATRLALDEARRLPAPQRVLFVPSMDALVIAGQAELARGRPVPARRWLKRAARELDLLLAELPSESLRLAASDVFRAAADGLVQCALAAPSGGATAAWTEARRAKARELRLALGQRVSRGRGRSASDRGLAAIEAEVLQLAAAESLSPTVRSKLRRLQVARRDLLDRGRQRRGDTTEAAMPDAAALSRRLGPSAALLEFHVGDETTWAFSVHAGQVRAFDLGIGERALDSTIRRLLEPLRLAGAGGDAASALDAFDEDLAARLHSRLVAVAIDALPSGVARLVIVPDGPLHELPFELLRARGGEWLDATHVIETIPSSVVLAAPRPTRLRAFAGLAHSPAPGQIVQRAAGPLSLAALPGARREVLEAARLFPRSAVATGRGATAAALARIAKGADVLHVAAHAISDLAAPGLSGLVVAGERGGLDFVTAERLREMSRAFELVMLSACESASGRLRRREGVLSMPRAFLEAGARAVVATRWPVDDRAARALTGTFYRHLVEGGPDPATALADARRALRERGGAWAHPFYWASFHVVEGGLPRLGPARRGTGTRRIGPQRRR